jgi:hypothetical protein
LELDSEKAIVQWLRRAGRAEGDTSGICIRQIILASPPDHQLRLQTLNARSPGEALPSDDKHEWFTSQQYCHPCLPCDTELTRKGDEVIDIAGEEWLCEKYEAPVGFRSLPPRIRLPIPAISAAGLKYWISNKIPGGLAKSEVWEARAERSSPFYGWTLKSFESVQAIANREL